MFIKVFGKKTQFDHRWDLLRHQPKRLDKKNKEKTIKCKPSQNLNSNIKKIQKIYKKSYPIKLGIKTLIMVAWAHGE